MAKRRRGRGSPSRRRPVIAQHWMWALFSLKRWGAWRRRDLHTTPLPWMRCTPSLPPRATPLLYGFSETVVPRPGTHSRDSCHGCPCPFTLVAPRLADRVLATVCARMWLLEVHNSHCRRCCHCCPPPEETAHRGASRSRSTGCHMLRVHAAYGTAAAACVVSACSSARTPSCGPPGYRRCR